jgi:hypothetical protein
VALKEFKAYDAVLIITRSRVITPPRAMVNLFLVIPTLTARLTVIKQWNHA